MLNNIFLKPALILIVIAAPFWFLIRIALRRKTPGIDSSFKKEILFFIFYIYLIGLAAVTLAPLNFFLHRVSRPENLNLIPFKTIAYEVQHKMIWSRRLLPTELLGNTPGNILLFIPLGLLLPMIRKRPFTFLRIFLTGLFCSAAIEFFQFIEGYFGIYRSVDIDDVILNTTGAILGWLIFRLLQAIARLFTPA